MQSRKAAYTLFEVMFAITIIILLSVIVMLLIDPRKQIENVWDSQRKRELSIMKRIFEDFYTDKGYYPRDTDVCVQNATHEDGNCYCYICGMESGAMGNYNTSKYCDPQNPSKNYLYQYSCNEEDLTGGSGGNTGGGSSGESDGGSIAGAKPQWFRLCASLSRPDNLDPGPIGFYNYGVSSGNVDFDSCEKYYYTTTSGEFTVVYEPTPTPSPTPIVPVTCPIDPVSKYCIKDGICNNCGDFANCQNHTSCDQPVQLYNNYSCSNECF